VSDSARPDIAAFRELEQLIRALGDEMAAWRRRAHEAESRLKATEARLERQVTPETPPAAVTPPNVALQRENEELRQRLEAARQRTKQLMERVRFLRQQHEMGGAER
jgi:uncharacterized protein YhaN